MSTENESVEEISEKFLQERAYVINENEVEVELKNVRAYPNIDKPTIVFTCGDPFDNLLLRFELGNLHEDAFNQVMSIYPGEFTGLETLLDSPIVLTRTERKSTVTEEIAELEMPVTFNNEEAHICESLRGYEYGIEKQYDMDELTKKYSKTILLYKNIEESIDNRDGVPVQDIKTTGSRSFTLKIGYNKNNTLPIELNLPDLSTINSHPVTKFIDNFGSGKIENLQDSKVYVGKDENLLGKDKRFDMYGLYQEYPSIKDDTGSEKTNDGVIGLVNKLIK